MKLIEVCIQVLYSILSFVLCLCLSSGESCTSSGLSSSAGVLSVGSPADGLDAATAPKVEPLDVSMLGQNLETIKGKNHNYLSVDFSELKVFSINDIW